MKSFHTFELFTFLYSNTLQDSRSKFLVDDGVIIGSLANRTRLCKQVVFRTSARKMVGISEAGFKREAAVTSGRFTLTTLPIQLQVYVLDVLHSIT